MTTDYGKFKSTYTFQVAVTTIMLFQSFFNFRVAIKTLKSARRREFDFLHFASQTETSFIDITHIPSPFVGHNDEVFRHKYTIQHDPKKIILNFCGYVV